MSKDECPHFPTIPRRQTTLNLDRHHTFFLLSIRAFLIPLYEILHTYRHTLCTTVRLRTNRAYRLQSASHGDCQIPPCPPGKKGEGTGQQRRLGCPRRRHLRGVVTDYPQWRLKTTGLHTAKTMTFSLPLSPRANIKSTSPMIAGGLLAMPGLIVDFWSMPPFQMKWTGRARR